MEKGSSDERGKRSCAASQPTLATPKTEAVDEAEEDESMAKFYALLRSIRVMRDLARTRNGENKRQKTEPSQLWKPTFLLEDFKNGVEDSVAAETGEAAAVEREEEGRRSQSTDRTGKRSREYVDLNLSL